MVGTSKIVGIVGLVISLIAGILAWFNIASNSYTLLDGYSFVIQYAQNGGKTTFTSGLGSYFNSSASNFGLIIIAFVLILIFWPATVISGAIEIARKGMGPYPGIWGILAFVFAFIFSNSLATSALSSTIGVGTILILVAAIVFFVAFALDRMAGSKEGIRPMQSTVQTPVPTQAYSCAACGAKFSSQTELDQHVKTMHATV